MWRMSHYISTHVVLNSIFPEVGIAATQHSQPYPPSSSDLTGRAKSGPAGRSVVANAILREIAASRFGPFVTVPMSVAKEAARARLIMQDDGIKSWKFHLGANYIGQHSTTAVKATLRPAEMQSSSQSDAIWLSISCSLCSSSGGYSNTISQHFGPLKSKAPHFLRTFWKHD